MYDAIYKSLFQYRLQQPEVFEIIIHPDNLKYVKNAIDGVLGTKIGDDEFQQYSIEYLQIWFSNPHNDSISLETTINRINFHWVKRFHQIKKSNIAIRENYLKAAKNSFVGQPKEFTAPINTQRSRILVLDQGYGENAISGKVESSKLF
jgi:hypothetical protein